MIGKLIVELLKIADHPAEQLGKERLFITLFDHQVKHFVSKRRSLVPGERVTNFEKALDLFDGVAQDGLEHL